MNAYQQNSPIAAIILAALAGAWMLASGAMMNAWSWPSGSPGNLMWGHGMMGGFSAQGSWPWIGLVAGVVLLVGALLLAIEPEHRTIWGTLILIVSVVNLFVGMGGIFAGLLGATGGLLAIASNSQR